MPFVNRRQEKLCWSEYEQARKEGRKPQWDCQEWENASRREKKKAPNPFFDYRHVTYPSFEKALVLSDILIDASMARIDGAF